MYAYLPMRSIYSELRSVPVRRLAGVLALIAASTTLALRIHSLNTPTRLELGPRAEMYAIVRALTDRVYEYSEQYGRPIFMLTGVRHVSPAESTLYERLRIDLTDDRILYMYSDQAFTIVWDDGRPRYWPSRRPPPIGLSRDWPASAAKYARTRWMAYDPGPYR